MYEYCACTRWKLQFLLDFLTSHCIAYPEFVSCVVERQLLNSEARSLQEFFCALHGMNSLLISLIGYPYLAEFFFSGIWHNVFNVFAECFNAGVDLQNNTSIMKGKESFKGQYIISEFDQINSLASWWRQLTGVTD